MYKALLVIDVQRDFCEGGSLPVEGGAEIASKISSYLTKYQAEYDLIVATRDWHPNDPNFSHFSDNPDYKDTWPVHCVAETVGAEYHPFLTQAYFDHEIYKGQESAAYSGFEGRYKWQDIDLSLDELCKDYGIKDIDICGLALDFCVKATALDSIKLGYNTTILTGLTAAVADFEGALEEFVANGGNTITGGF